jgi:hypothetical protein
MKGAFSHATGSRLCIHLAHHIRLLACGWPRTLHPPPPVEFHSRTPRSHPWLQAPGHRHAVAVHRPTHRRAARAGDIACSKHCRELERLTWSSPRIGTASPRRALHSALCRLEPPSSSPPLGSACPLHARCSAACHRQQLPCAWGSPRAGSVFLLRARCSGACRRQQPIWGSPRAGSACPRHAPGNSPCRLDPLWCSPPAHTAACPWPSSRLTPRFAAENPNSLRCAIPSRHPPPLSPQRSASAHRTPYTRRWQCESRSDVGFMCR